MSLPLLPVFWGVSGGGAVGERAVSSAQRMDLARAGTAQRFRPRWLSGGFIKQVQ